MTLTRPQRNLRRLCVALLLFAPLPLLAGACSPSVEALEEKVEDEPGVVKVEVVEGGGDDFIPFANIPKSIWVVMEADASADEVMSVFDKYDDDVDDDDVDRVEVRLEGPKKATLHAGTGIKVERDLVEGLVEAQANPDILSYSRTAAPVVRDVELTLVPLEFDQVIAVADRYRDDPDIEIVQVESGHYLLIRDAVNEDLSRTSARERFVLLVEERFRLNGASVAGRGPLVIYVVPADEDAVRALADRSDRAELGKIVVHGLDGPRLP